MDGLLAKRTAGLVIRNQDVELLVMRGKRVVSCLRLPIEGKEDSHLVAAIQKAVADAGLKTGELAVAMPSPDILVRFFAIPAVPKGELDSAVQFEARKYTPFKIDSLIWDHRVARGEAAGRLEVVFTAVPREVFHRVTEILRAANLQPTAIEPRSVSLARLVEPPSGKPSNEFTCIVDVDQDTAHLVIVKNRMPYMTRDMSLVGGAGAPGLGGPQPAPSTAEAEPQADESGSAEPEGPGGPQAQRLLSELNVSMGFFMREHPSTSITRVLVCGDEKRIAPWCRWLSDHLHCPVELGSALVEKRVHGGLSLSFASAVGLLQRAKERAGSSVDFLSRAAALEPGAAQATPHIKKAREILASLKTPRVAVCAGAAVTLLIGWAVASAMIISAERRLVTETINARPDLGWGLSAKTAQELAPIQEQVERHLELLRRVVGHRLSVAAKLDALARSLPEGIWLTEIAYEDPLTAAGVSQPTLKVKGACYLGEAGRELSAIQQFEQQVKRNQAFARGFTDARIGEISARVKPQQYTYRTFQLNCDAGRKL